MRDANLTRSMNGGTQRLYRFDNGYGASVVRHHGSYGSAEGLWELAVVTFKSDDILNFSLTYSTPVTDDVLGHLSEGDVDAALAEVEELPKEAN